MITDIFRAAIKSYRDLPQNLYHIQWKFRDEVRPRFGVMRGREFLMKDAYSFDLDSAGARHSYNKMFVAYLRTFARMGLKAIPMRADTGPIGGDLSHEFIILAETGESEVFCHKDFLDRRSRRPRSTSTTMPTVQPVVEHWTSALRRDRREARRRGAARGAGGQAASAARGIEVGHIFYFGTKYSEPMGARRRARTARPVPLEMGSYGIGVSRLVGAHHRGEPRRRRHHLAGERRAVPRRPDQSARRRCRLPTRRRDDLYAKLHGAGRRGALRRPRRARRRQVRDDGSDRPALAADRRPARRSPPARSSSRTARTGERQEMSLDAALGRLTAALNKASSA